MALSIERKFGLSDYRWVAGTDDTWGEGIDLKIRRWGNRDYENYRQERQVGLMGPVVAGALKRTFDRDSEVNFDVDDDVVRLYTSKDFKGVSTYVLVDWRGVREIDSDGNESDEDSAYSAELGATLFADNLALFDLVIAESQNQEAFRKEFLESVAKN